MSVCFQVNLYEKTLNEMADYKIESFLEAFNGFDFEEKIIVINNVFSNLDCLKKLEKFEDDFIIKFADSEDTDMIFESFGIDPKSMEKGFVYSIPHFLTLYYTNCDYVLHISEDIELNVIGKNFIADSIEKLEDERYVSSMPNWGGDGPWLEKEFEDGNFLVEYGFTDQVFLLKTKVFKQHIYNFKHVKSERYPAYGGECFEKRVDSYMRCNNKYRIVHKDFSYKHLKWG